MRIEAIRADRAAIEFRGLPPSRDRQLKKELGDKITVQTSDWNCGNLITPNRRRSRSTMCGCAGRCCWRSTRWHGAPALSKIANVHTVGGIVFPGSPLAATKDELQQMAGFWPDIEKSRAEAQAAAEGGRRRRTCSFELLNRNVDQPYKYVGTWIVDEWSKIGVQGHAEGGADRPLVRGDAQPAISTCRAEANCNGVVNPLIDAQTYLPNLGLQRNYGGYEDPSEVTSTTRCCARPTSPSSGR